MTSSILRFVWLSVLLVGSADGATRDWQEPHRQAVQLARDGQLAIAIGQLDELVVQHPDASVIAIDRAVVLTWAKRPADALVLLDRMPANELPGYALEALGKAARDAKRPELALALYEQLIVSDPENINGYLGRALSISDTGDGPRALDELRLLSRTRPDKAIDVLGTMADLAAGDNDWLTVAHAHQRILEIEPGRAASLAALARALRSVGLPILAKDIVAKRPDLFDDEFVAALDTDVSAQHIRWSALPAPRASIERTQAESTLVVVEANLGNEWNKLDPSDPVARRRLLDYIVALHNANAMEEVVAVYEFLERREVDIPIYAQLSAASALLYLEQPRRARILYESALAQEPNNIEAQMGQYYALVETEDLIDAEAYIEAVDRAQAPWKIGSDSRIVQENPNKYRTTLALALAPALGDHVAESHRRLDRLVAEAPSNTDLRSARAQVHRWRGWPRRAIREVTPILRFEPELVSARLVKAHAHLDVGEQVETEQELAYLKRELPDQKHVLSLERRLTNYRSWQVSSEFSAGQSSGGTESGSRFLQLTTELLSKPFATHYRAFARHKFLVSSFSDQNVRFHRLELGATREARDWRVTASVTGGSNDHRDLGVAAEASWRPNDHLTVSLFGAIEPDDLPIRAIRDGIGGDQIGGALGYRASESFSAEARYSRLHFDDGNERESTQLTMQRRLLARPKHRVDVDAELYASRNSLPDRVYFSPRGDFAASAGVTHDWRWHRHYQREFHHRIRVGAGRYGQRGFTPALTWSLMLEQDWQWDERSTMRLRWERSRRVFDGEPEYESVVNGEIRWLF